MTNAGNSGRPLVVDIKRHSLEDGPGIRSVVFFKGCPLRCVFCHSPETQNVGQEIAFSPSECIGCGACAEACPQGAVDLSLPGRILRDRCDCCGACAEACPGKGLRLIGTYYPVEALVEVLLRDAVYYKHSGGGVTLSGGECTLIPEYVGMLLGLLKAEGVHVALETSGHFGYAAFSKHILPHIDLVYYDIKIIDADAHKRYTGQDNRLILANFRKLLAERTVTVHPRTPLVPGITATRQNLAAVVDFLCDAGADSMSLLPYNPLGLAMWERLGRPRPDLPEAFTDRNEEQAIRDFVQGLISAKRSALKVEVNQEPGTTET
jgi:pyruvate formate lyase activating enzyme